MQDSQLHFFNAITRILTYKDIYQHMQCQSVLLSSPAEPCSNFLAVLLDKPHDLLHVFADISQLVLLQHRNIQTLLLD